MVENVESWATLVDYSMDGCPVKGCVTLEDLYSE